MSTAEKFNIVVINKAGKVGKSTLAKHLIAPVLKAEWIQVETFNDTGQGQATKVSGRTFGFVAEEIALSGRSMCIDIGNSNYEAAKKEMQQIEYFANEVDFWVLPCRESSGAMNDTVTTIQDLINDLGVDASRIVVIPNDIEVPEDTQRTFDSVVRAAGKWGFQFCETSVIQSKVFDELNSDRRSVFEIAEDETDFDQLIAHEVDKMKKTRLARAKVMRGRARGLVRNLCGVWNSSPLNSLGQATVGFLAK